MAASRTALFLCATLVLLPLLMLAAQDGNDVKSEPPADGGWPRTYMTPDGGTAVIYQPQIEDWENQKHMTAWAAVSYEAPAAKQPAPGTIRIEADTDVALDERLVNFTEFRIIQFNFPSLGRDQSLDLVEGLQQAIPQTERVIALDRILADINKSEIRLRTDPAGLNDTPPRIFHSAMPALLVIFDGQPVWSPIRNADLKYAVNTNWDEFQEASSNTFYLRNNETWLKASDIKGPWTPAGQLPGGFKDLPDDNNWKDVRANLPGKAIPANSTPKVFVSFEPAELILLKGPPQYKPVPGTSLLWISNTESDVFRAGQNGSFYYLASGRWFSAPALAGPWKFATPNLPAAFKTIPLDHPRSHVLASVPGTDQAAEAVLLAQIPTTARVSTTALKPPDVKYQGAPNFVPIPGTSLSYANNTDKEIIKEDGLYYMCFEGVWFRAPDPAGPWEVAKSVASEIYRIPASSPVHNVTYVTVEPDNDDSNWVNFAYTAGYVGTMVAWGTAVWGTGWYYPPYIASGGAYPAYFWHAPTYGYAAAYNPWTGTYGRGAAAYGPYGGAGVGARYNPATGTYARGAAAYGPYGSREFAQAYNPRTGAAGVARGGSNVYGNWGSSYVQRGDQWAHTAPQGRTTFAEGAGGNMYAGHDGNVYRHEQGSGWQQYGNGGWSQAHQADFGQLQHDQSARLEGVQRTRDQGAWRSSGASRAGAGSFRFGGGRAGGGGFRRR